MTLHPIIQEDIKDINKTLKNKLKKLEGKNVLITGSTGMLASYIVYVLIFANESIFSKPVKLFLVSRKANKKFGQKPYLNYIQADVAKGLPPLPTIHYAIHAASKAAPKFYMKNPIDTFNTNVLGLLNVLNVCNKSTESVLFFSSSEIYGNFSEDKLISEKDLGNVDSLNPRAVYAEAKRAAETICMNYFFENKLPIKIARIFHTFGPGLNLTDGRVFSDFISMAIKNKKISIQGNPSLKRTFLYIKDATIMFLLLLLSNKNGEAFNIGGTNKNTKSVLEFANLVSRSYKTVTKKGISVIVKRENLDYYKSAVHSASPNIKKFTKQFNYTPETDLLTACTKTLKFYLNN